MQTYDASYRRQFMGCGYEPPALDAHAHAWDGTELGRTLQRDELDDDGRVRLPVCPGYVCALPEVHEAAQAHFFLKNGGLGQFVDAGDHPTQALRDSVTVLECEYARVLEWCSRHPQKAGH